MPRRLLTIALSMLLVAVPNGARAQLGLLPAGEGPTLHLELMKPFFESSGFFGGGFGFATSMLDATVVVPFCSGPTLFGRLGVMYATAEGASSSSVLSSPRIGVLFGGEATTHGEIHVDLPLASEFGDDDYAAFVALVTDFERFERFVPDAWSVGGSVTGQSVTESGARLGGRVGANVVIPTGSGTESELFALYAAFARFPAGSTRLGAELSGIAFVSESGSLGERTTSHLTLSVALPEVGASPEAYVRLPLDDDVSAVLALVLGVRVRFGG